MRRVLVLTAAFLTMTSLSRAAEPAIAYPPAPRGTVSDTSFGVTVPDPYRWLEESVRTAPAVSAWVEAENKVTQKELAKLPQREAIRDRLTKLWDFEKFKVPETAGGRTFYGHNTGLQNQFELFVQDGPDAAPRKLLDPNGWASDGATALAEWKASPDGKHLAYAVQDGGTDWRIVKMLDVDTAREAAGDQLRWVKFSGLSWAADSSGFFYSRYAEPAQGAEYQSTNLDQTVYFHKLGTAQAQDRKVYSTPDRPKLTHDAEATEDGRYLLIYSRDGTDDKCQVTLLDLRDPAWKPRTLVASMEDSFALAGAEGDKLYFVTNRSAPNYRLVAVDAAKPGEAELQPLVPEAKSAIEKASLIGGKLIVTYIEDAKSVVRLFGKDGQAQGEIALPGIGSVTGFEGRADDEETYYRFSSFALPPTLYRYDVASGRSSVFKQPKVPFDPADYVVSQVFYPSKDGTKIPMFIAHRKDVDVTKPHPTLLYAYGGFNVSILPAFDTTRLAWMQMGGVYAVANLRGGGEYGKAWHDGGRLLKKQNVFDDFIAAGEYLVKTKVTTPRQLAVYGRSNGGLLIGAVVNQRPELFAAALPAVGVQDMLRFNQFTAGRFWTDDYGDPANEADFRNLLTFSPYHNIKDGKDYPPILVTTADTDDRVVPGHSFKYAAALQAAKIGPKPHLIRIETRAGHGSGKPTDKIIAEYADMWAFIGFYTGLTRH
jgi:prolyl oligopeptidase